MHMHKNVDSIQAQMQVLWKPETNFRLVCKTENWNFYWSSVKTQKFKKLETAKRTSMRVYIALYQYMVYKTENRKQKNSA